MRPAGVWADKAALALVAAQHAITWHVHLEDCVKVISGGDQYHYHLTLRAGHYVCPSP